MWSLFNYQSFACHRYTAIHRANVREIYNPRGLSDCKPVKHGLKRFWGELFFERPDWKKTIFFCMFSYSKNVCRECHRWYAAPQERALQYSYTVLLLSKSIDRRHKTVHVTQSSNVHHKQYTFTAVRRTLWTWPSATHASTSTLQIRWFRCNRSPSPLTIRQNAFWRSRNALLIDVDNDVVREGMQRRTKLCTLSCTKLFWRAGQILCSPFVQHSALSCRLQKAFLQVGTAIQGIVCAKTGCSLVYAQ